MWVQGHSRPWRRLNLLPQAIYQLDAQLSADIRLALRDLRPAQSATGGGCPHLWDAVVRDVPTSAIGNCADMISVAFLLPG